MLPRNQIAPYLFALAVTALGSCPSTSTAAERELRSNYFGDPFFKVANGFAECPEPLGPRVTEQEMKAQSHHRAERGTTCFLRGECEKPNSYAYDVEIAKVIKTRWSDDPKRALMTIWVTVQARVVYFEGCSKKGEDGPALEAFARTVDDVQQSIATVFNPRAGGDAPYKTLAPYAYVDRPR